MTKVNNVTFMYSVTSELKTTIDKAADFHGHLGPFLVIGVRMSLIGIRELNLKKNENGLRVTAMLRNRTPFSCILDGIQVVTRCTMGNRKLRLKNYSSRIAAKFELQNEEKEVNVLVNPATFEDLKTRLLAEDVSPEEVRKLAHAVASMPEEKLFIIRSR